MGCAGLQQQSPWRKKGTLTLRHTAPHWVETLRSTHAAAHNTTCTHRQILTTRQVLGSSSRPAATSCCNRHHHRGEISSCSCCCPEATHAMWHGLPEAAECTHRRARAPCSTHWHCLYPASYNSGQEPPCLGRLALDGWISLVRSVVGLSCTCMTCTTAQGGSSLQSVSQSVSQPSATHTATPSSHH